MKRRKVFLAHPLAGDVPANLARAKRWLRWLIDRYPYHTVIAPWITYAEVFDDGAPEEREHGRLMSLAQLAECDECVFVGGTMSPGMETERLVCQALGITVTNYTETHGEEPPVHG